MVFINYIDKKNFISIIHWFFIRNYPFLLFMKGITPCLWFNNNAQEAAEFYTGIFRDSSMGIITHYTPEGAIASNMPEGSVMTVAFKIAGQEFMALNGGPMFKFSEAISFVVHCETQAEIDEYWEKLSAGGGAGQCGWLKDKYGVSWQIVPDALNKMMSDKDINRRRKVTQALLKMQKLDIKKLEEASRK